MSAHEIVGAERDALILDVLKRIREAKPHADARAWEANWREQLERFRAAPSEDALVPAFIKPDQPVRMNGGFWRGVSELEYCRGLQAWIAEQLNGFAHVVEFGCGAGFNLFALSRLLPETRLTGYDLSEFAVALVNEAAKHNGANVIAAEFDMLAPHMAPILYCNAAFTFGAMEQLGNFAPFIDYLVLQRPARVVHIEPIPELLDENNLIDWLSLRFHEKRGYTRGLLPYLLQHPAIEVEQVERSHFGSLMIESYAKIVWRPK